MRERTKGLVDRNGPVRVLRELEQAVLQKALRGRRPATLEVANA